MRGTLPQSVRQHQGQLEWLQKSFPAMLKRMGRLGVQGGVAISAISALKLAGMWLHLFRIGLAWHTVGFFIYGILSILEPYCHHKASNHLIFSELMHHFYL